jgi:catechol 2,3-dioxygenase-like lactoylglutathione lyase family enzyme
MTGGDGRKMPAPAILETCLYARDLATAEAFYGDVLGLELFAKMGGRHLFYRLGGQMLLIFNPDATIVPLAAGALGAPPHGASGPGHICFRASADEITTWRSRLAAKGVAIEADCTWPGGGRSIYLRDPAGNSLEFAEPRIWNLT